MGLGLLYGIYSLVKSSLPTDTLIAITIFYLITLTVLFDVGFEFLATILLFTYIGAIVVLHAGAFLNVSQVKMFSKDTINIIKKGSPFVTKSLFIILIVLLGLLSISFFEPISASDIYSFSKNPEDASLYLTEALSDLEIDGDVESFLKALKDVTEAQGGIGELAKKTNLNRQNLYKVLSAKRQPKIGTLGVILDGLGFQLNVIPKL